MKSPMNKSLAGYHMLRILSCVDGLLSSKEHQVISQYMQEQKLVSDAVESDNNLLDTLPVEDYPVHFNNAMNAFYMDSSPDDRNHFLDLAVKLVIADQKITPRENLFLDELFNAWEANYSY